MHTKGSLPGISQTQSLATSDSLNQIAAIPLVSSYSATPNTTGDTVVDLIDSTYFNLVGQFATTPFTVNSKSFPAHGRFVFYNSNSKSMYIVTQADSSAALEADYAVETIDLTKANSCNATFASSSTSAVAPGGYATTQIVSGTDCAFTAVSNAPWIVLTSGYYGSGNTTLTYLVRPNLVSSSRSGTITIGSQTFTVTQNAAGPLTDLNPLSVKPVAADYNKALDKVVFVNSSPNELHIYDPITQNDQIIPLASVPLSVSVSPDGQSAAVGHAESMSYVDLQGLKVTKVIPLDISAAGVLLAGNGYAYVFSSTTYPYSSAGYSIQLSTGTLTAISSAAGYIPRLYPTAPYIYLAGGGAGKLDITNGTATTVSNNSFFFSDSNLWLSEDGVRMITSAGTAYFTSVVTSQDFAAAGNLSAANSVAWAANSATQHETAVLTGDSYSGTAINTQLQIYADNGLQLQSQLGMPSFSAGGASYVSHGRYVFWNAAATKLFVFTEADSTSGLLSDYAEYTVEAPQSIPACTYIVSPTSLNIGPSPGNSFTLNVTTTCSWTSSVSANWIYALNTSPTVGNATLSVGASYNSGAARSGTITVGNQTVTINQADASCTYTLSATSASFTQTGGTGTVNLTTGNGCAWTLQSNAAWLTITSAQSGVGPAAIQYSIAPNNSTNSYLYGSFSVAESTYFSVSQVTVTPPTPLSFVTVTPCRVVDTRFTGGQPYLVGGTTRTFYVPASSCGIPSTAAAYSLNVTVAPHGALNYLSIWPSGQIQPVVSTLNSDGRVKANAAIVPAGFLGGVNAYATNDTDLILDINGYFTSDTGLEYYNLTPCRIADTRGAVDMVGLGGPALAPGQARDFPILQSACNVPSTAQAYSLNFTAVPPSLIGYLSTWPAGQTMPVVSTLNASNANVTANAAIVPVGTAGDIEVYSSHKTDLVLDISGYFAPAASAGLHFYTATPCRVLDTRFSGTQKAFTGSVEVPVAGLCGIPSTAAAVVANVTVVPQSLLGYLAVWQYGINQPLASILNAEDGVVTSNMGIIPLGTGGAISAYASSATHMIVDVSGYFAP